MIPFDLPRIIPGNYGSVRVVEVWKNNYVLKVNDEVWMTFGSTKQQAYEVYSHNWFAYGDVICTGLGFCVREKMLLSNPRVKSITVLERSQDLIDYQRQINPDIMEQLNVVCCDANKYIGSCDVLLVDHFERMSDRRKSVISASKNIQHKVLWWWTADNLGWEDYQQLSKQLPTMPNLNRDQLLLLNHLFKCQDI